MEIREFAQQVLFSTSIEDKLYAPARFTDEKPGLSIETPDAPGRPPSIPLFSEQVIPHAPTPQGLVHEHARGLALHSFAHHELQAFELMALALLKWPNAPKGFRRGLAQIIRDEQRHFALYTARAEDWGTALGDVGVGHFFWDTVAKLNTPEAFLAAMSLTFEQANLDFATYWKSAFSAVDDQESVSILQTVYEDEIRHVRHGVKWFERLQGGCDIESHAEMLHFPLSVGRAKGPLYNREARVLAGLSEDYVDALEIRNVSRGRPPRVFYFDPRIEEQVAGRTASQATEVLKSDLAGLMMFLAHKEDVVIADRPSTSFLLPLHRIGFPIPEFTSDLPTLRQRKLGSLQPWGWSPAIAKILPPKTAITNPTLYDKTWAHQQRISFRETESHPAILKEASRVTQSMVEIEALLEDGNEWVIKAPLSSSGQRRIRCTHPLPQNARSWISKQLRSGPVLIEPWHTRLADFSTQIEVQDDKIKIVGRSRFWTTASGVYRGAIIGHWSAGLPQPLIRTLHEAQFNSILDKAALHIGKEAQHLGYRGPLGIDSMAILHNDTVRIQPILEVNPRYTMGRIALAIQKRCKGVGTWCFLRKADLEKANYADFGQFTERLQTLPQQIEDGRFVEGFIPTNDPSTAQEVLTVLAVGRSLEEIKIRWTDLGLDWPAQQ